MPKLDFDEVMERVNNEQPVSADEIKARVLKRKIWIASNGLTGCMNDSTSVLTKKKDAIETCAQIADNGEGAPRGLVRALRARGDNYFTEDGYYVYRVERGVVADLL